MTTSQLNSFLTQETFHRSAVPQPGRIYLTLCGIFPLQKIKNKGHHLQALSFLTKLSELLQQTEKIPFQERKQILDYMDALGLLTEEYERKKIKSHVKNISGSDVLEFLIEQHSLKQSDLENELGSQSIVSEILSHKRRLNSQQILLLSRRFGVSPSAFFP